MKDNFGRVTESVTILPTTVPRVDTGEKKKNVDCLL